ncbi:thiamine biosynthesis protein ThiF [Rhodanobacter sp. Root627]|uniref:HesA/MoeB/ThiF family protein n=1 Tax=Rhodanobacter sp. Root627 TaxID=1736572 RepID=UPI0006F944EC|nr:HesA/MoeB/ThiF family protein [Rhodanobacter sp. Root627]KRA33911.1 thiamine biosynthesis protein ThiF [Rhodanobacter sp. Root627]
MSDRYARQVVLPHVGKAGQARLAAAHVLVIGAGGLGCPVLQYLAGAGIGRITVIDHDYVEESNLHRQPLYAMSDIGSFKAQAARAALLRLNPTITVEALAQRLTPANAAALVAGVDVVVDAADSLAVTYTVSDASLQLGRPLISASAVGLAGYVGGFCGGAPSYRAVFPDMPTRAASCSSAGVLGSMVGMIGSLQAQCVLQLLLDIAPSPLGRLLSFDAGRLAFGGFDFHGASEPEDDVLRFIDVGDVARGDLVIDLRSQDEAPISPLATALRFTPEHIDAFIDAHPPADRRVVLCCHSGVRAWRVGRQLQSRGYANLALATLAGIPA